MSRSQILGGMIYRKTPPIINVYVLGGGGIGGAGKGSGGGGGGGAVTKCNYQTALCTTYTITVGGSASGSSAFCANGNAGGSGCGTTGGNSPGGNGGCFNTGFHSGGSGGNWTYHSCCYCGLGVVDFTFYWGGGGAGSWTNGSSGSFNYCQRTPYTCGGGGGGGLFLCCFSTTSSGGGGGGAYGLYAYTLYGSGAWGCNDGGTGGSTGGGAGGRYGRRPPFNCTGVPYDVSPVAGCANTGGGGGGRGICTSGVAGGSGKVIIKYNSSYPQATSTTGSPSYSCSGGFKTYTFTGSGSIKW